MDLNPPQLIPHSTIDDHQQVPIPTGTSAMTGQYAYDRDRLIYELIVRQEPKQARMCGVGGKADRRPIDPPPIVQLRVIDPATQQAGTSSTTPSRRRRDSSSDSVPGSPNPGSSSSTRPQGDDNDVGGYAQSFLQNPYYFMFASLARPDDDNELHWLKDGRTRCTTGSVVSSLYHLKDPQNNNEDAGFFVFPDLSVRTEGSYRLKLSLFEVVANSINNVRHCKSIYSAPFYVYTAKKFPGMEESTPLSCSLADQGIKIRIRKDIRVRKRPNPDLLRPLPSNVEETDNDDDDEVGSTRPQHKRRESKRSRMDESADISPSTLNVGPGPDLATVPQQQNTPWPPVAPVNSNLGPTIPPPTPQGIPPPPKPGQDIPPPGNTPMGIHANASATLPGPSVFDGRGGGLMTFELPQQPQSQQPPALPQPPVIPQGPPPQYRDSLHPPAQQQQLPPPPHPHHQQYTPSQPTIPQQQQQPMAPPMAPHHGMPPHAAPPPLPQAYAPYPQWGAPPPPPQQPVYDAYYHHHQQQQQGMHPHYAAYPQQPMPPPGRYDYSHAMYSQQPPPPHAMPQYPYYEQPPQAHPHHQQMGQLPPPPPQHQTAPPSTHPIQPPPPPQYAPVAPPSNGSTNSPNSIQPALAPPATPASTYDYSASYRAPTGSPQPRPPYHPAQAPYAQAYAMHPPPPPMQPRHNPYGPPAPPPYPYAAYGAPPNPGPSAPTQAEWGSTPAFGVPPATGNPWGDPYAVQQPQPQPIPHPQQQPPHQQPQIPQQQHLQQQQQSPSHGQPQQQQHSPTVPAVSSGSLGDPNRIQLAPLLRGPPGNNTSPLMAHTGVSSPSSPGSGGASNVAAPSAYPIIQLRSSSRSSYASSSLGRDKERERERDDLRARDRERDTDRQGGSGKKNPLSIGSIISDDGRR